MEQHTATSETGTVTSDLDEGVVAGTAPVPVGEGAGRVVVFDLGGVLIDWDPRRLYRAMLGDDAAVEAFLDEIGFAEWNHLQDAGRPFASAVEELSRRHPARAELIAAYPRRFGETLVGEVAGSVAVLEELRRAGVSLYALTNWSAETFGEARARFPFLSLFRGIVVSGEIGLAKPDPRIYHHLLEQFGLRAGEVVYIDDAERNVRTAADVGMDAVRFTDAASLRGQLAERGLPVAPA